MSKTYYALGLHVVIPDPAKEITIKSAIEKEHWRIEVFKSYTDKKHNIDIETLPRPLYEPQKNLVELYNKLVEAHGSRFFCQMTLCYTMSGQRYIYGGTIFTFGK